MNENLLVRTLNGASDVWQTSARILSHMQQSSRRQMLGQASEDPYILEWWKR